MTTPRIGAEAPEIDLLVNQNETFRARLVYRVAGEPQSLEGYGARMSIARRFGGRAIVTVEDGDGLTLEPVDEETGEVITGAIDIHLSPERTALLRRNGVYDLFLIDTTEGLESDRLFKGTVWVRPAATSLA